MGKNIEKEAARMERRLASTEEVQWFMLHVQRDQLAKAQRLLVLAGAAHYAVTRPHEGVPRAVSVLGNYLEELGRDYTFYLPPKGKAALAIRKFLRAHRPRTRRIRRKR